MKKSIAVALALVLLSFAASAEVKVEMKQEKITVQNGKESKSSADQAAPGEIIQYTATTRNTEKAPVTGVATTIPIPANTEYIAGSATPAGAMASTDGTNFSPIPLKRTVKNAQGKTVEQEVPASEYRALRWSFGSLAGNESRAVSARVKVR